MIRRQVDVNLQACRTEVLPMPERSRRRPEQDLGDTRGVASMLAWLSGYSGATRHEGTKPCFEGVRLPAKAAVRNVPPKSTLEHV